MKLSSDHYAKIQKANSEACVHVCSPATCPDDRFYFITAIDGSSWWIMAGPYASHAAALADVSRVSLITSDHHAKAWFMRWGTVHIEGHSEPGNLNKASLI